MHCALLGNSLQRCIMAAMKYDATMTMAFTLLSVDAEGTPSTALGPKMGMESTSLSRLLNTMEERGYIERRPNLMTGEAY